MALLRTKEIRAMEPGSRDKKLHELRDELMHERGVAAMGGAPPNPGKIRALRKNIARIHTVQREEAALGAPVARPEAGTRSVPERPGEREEEEIEEDEELRDEEDAD